MKMLPTVSVIVPVYGVEKYIERCARSIFVQTYKDFEVIFVDDCSKDNSIAILKGVIEEYPAVDCRIIRHERNRGLSAARNTGVTAAFGKYILHVDSDDWIEPEMIGCLVKKATETNADIVICGNNIVFPDKLRISYPRVYDDKMTMIKAMLFKSVPSSMWGKLISKEIYDQHEDTWSIEGINHGEDYATMPRIIFYSELISYVNEPLYNYSMLNAYSYTNNFSEKSMVSMVKADNVLYDFFNSQIKEEDKARMLLRSKTGMIKRCNWKLYPQIAKLYHDVQKKYINQLSFYDRFILYSVNRGFDRTLARLLRLSLRLRQEC